MSPTPIALPAALPSELLEYIITHQAYPTTLLICQPRGTFLSSLVKAVKHTAPSNTSDLLPAPISKLQPERHPLLTPTLHQVATSRHINLVFIPTVTHFRAYLAVFPNPETKEGPPKHEWDKKGRNTPLLVVYGVLGLHKDTSEWSAQGLGNSLAGAVEAGWRSGRRVVVIEENGIEDDRDEDVGGVEEEEEVQDRRKRCKVWEERVPMLNGNVRRAGLESEEGGWSGRTVEVGRILARWFKFRKGDWVNEVQA